MYLDNGASTRVKQEVLDAMMPYLKEQFFNPSTLYSDSKRVKIAMDNARKTVADFINAKPNEIYFTSGGSESNCWAIQGFINNRLDNGHVPYIITTQIEHKSIMKCVKSQKLCHVDYVDIYDDGCVSLTDLDNAIVAAINAGIEPKDILVSIQFANNEIGSIQDVINIGNIVHMYSCTFHTDAVQAYGHVFIDVDAMNIDMLSASAHKIGSCKGTGILYIKKGVKIKPLIFGSQNGGMRGGTENVAGIIGMAKATELAKDTWKNGAATAMTRDYFIEKLEGIGCRLNGSREYRLPNNISVIMPDDINGEALLYMLDVDGIQIGTGSACNSHDTKISHVLKAIHLTKADANSTIRITIPDDMTMDEVDNVVECIEKAIKVLKTPID